MPEQPPPDEVLDLLTVYEVADLLRIHIRTVQRLVQDGRLPVVKLGNRKSRVRFHRRDIVDFVEGSTQRRGPTQ